MPRLRPHFSSGPFLLLMGLTLGLYFLAATAHRTVQLYQLKQEEARLQREVRALEARHQQLQAERDRLTSDTDVEKIAREQLNLIKPGETAVIVLASQEAVERARQEQPAPPRQEQPPLWLGWLAWLWGR